MQVSATQLLKPNIVEVRDIGKNTAKITIEPLDRGFGHTLGNALRRVPSFVHAGLRGDGSRD